MRNRQLVDGKTVYLGKDASETDRYGRLLSHVWLDDETMVNAAPVFLGSEVGNPSGVDSYMYLDEMVDPTSIDD